MKADKSELECVVKAQKAEIKLLRAALHRMMEAFTPYDYWMGVGIREQADEAMGYQVDEVIEYNPNNWLHDYAAASRGE